MLLKSLVPKRVLLQTEFSGVTFGVDTYLTPEDVALPPSEFTQRIVLPLAELLFMGIERSLEKDAEKGEAK
jgi:hypothetical protein